MISRLRPFAFTLVAALSVMPLVFADDVPPKPVDGAIHWVYSYDEGKQVAHDTGKPMFVVFRCER
jgi:hypothetical protein